MEYCAFDSVIITNYSLIYCCFNVTFDIPIYSSNIIIFNITSKMKIYTSINTKKKKKIKYSYNFNLNSADTISANKTSTI